MSTPKKQVRTSSGMFIDRPSEDCHMYSRMRVIVTWAGRSTGKQSLKGANFAAPRG